MLGPFDLGILGGVPGGDQFGRGWVKLNGSHFLSPNSYL
jgi:hypothetical protein